MRSPEQWKRYAKALDMHLAGHTLREVGDKLGISRERARQMIAVAKRRLGYRDSGISANATPKWCDQ